MRLILLIILLLILAFAVVTYWRATARETRIEAAYPPSGTLVTVDGRQVHVVVEGTGPDLVLIHGAGGNARDFTHQFTAQLTDRYRVFSVDRPGHGWSDPIGADHGSVFAADAATPMAQARHLAKAVRQLGADKPLVLGHSYGGSLAMAWALEEPASGVLVLSGASMPWPGELRRYYRFFGSGIGGALGAPLVSAWVTEERVRASLEGVFDPQPVDPTYYEGAAVPLATRTDSFRINARQVKNLRPNLVEMSKRYPDITLPIEIVHGTADTTVRPEVHAEPLMQTLGNGQLTLLPGQGHAPHQTAPQDVNAAIDRLAARAGLR